jgi:hypothetical protein
MSQYDIIFAINISPSEVNFQEHYVKLEKGEILVGTNTTPTKLPAADNDSILVYDSNEVSGFKSISKTTLWDSILQSKPSVSSITNLVADTCTSNLNSAFSTTYFNAELYTSLPGFIVRNSNVTGFFAVGEGLKVYSPSESKTEVMSVVEALFDGEDTYIEVDDLHSYDEPFGDERIFYPDGVQGSNLALGLNTVSSGKFSTSFGVDSVASGDQSNAHGYNTLASGLYSHAEGIGTVASGTASHAEGRNTQATNSYAKSFGDGCIASGSTSLAGGKSTTASGYASFCIGSYSEASGNYSKALGSVVKATGDYSFCSGLGSGSSYPEAQGMNTFVHQHVEPNQGVKIAKAINSAILGGKNHSNFSTAENSVILGGEGIHATLQNTAHVQFLKLKPSSINDLNTVLNSSHAGLIMFDSSDSVLKCYDGTQWKSLFI